MTNPKTIDPDAARRALEDSDAMLLDVREDDEWAAGHAPQATHIRLADLDPGAVTPDNPVIVVCRSGSRSHKAAVALTEAGRTVYNLVGGMKAWQQSGYPVVRDDGTTGAVI